MFFILHRRKIGSQLFFLMTVTLLWFTFGLINVNNNVSQISALTVQKSIWVSIRHIGHTVHENDNVCYILKYMWHIQSYVYVNVRYLWMMDVNYTKYFSLVTTSLCCCVLPAAGCWWHRPCPPGPPRPLSPCSWEAQHGCWPEGWSASAALRTWWQLQGDTQRTCPAESWTSNGLWMSILCSLRSTNVLFCLSTVWKPQEIQSNWEKVQIITLEKLEPGNNCLTNNVFLLKRMCL